MWQRLLAWARGPRLEPGENPCAACARLYGVTCCEHREPNRLRLPMSRGEAERIAELVGIPVEEAAVRVEVSAKEREALRRCAGDEIAELTRDGEALVVPLDERGRCLFLGEGGCTIGEAKPMVCALYPFSKIEERWRIGWLAQKRGICLGQDVARGDLRAAMRVFGVEEGRLEGILDRFER